jgi:hypothetical protein
MIGLPILLQEGCGPIPGIYKSPTDGTGAAQFTEKEYINGIFVAVQHNFYLKRSHKYPSTGAPLNFFHYVFPAPNWYISKRKLTYH